MKRSQYFGAMENHFIWFIKSLFNPDIDKGKQVSTMRKTGFFSKKKTVSIFYRQANHS